MSLDNLFRFVVLLLFVFPAAPAVAADREREERLRDEIVDVIFAGEPVMLSDGANEFLAIHLATDGPSRGGAIIMHGRGYHPDWTEVANPLRVGLAERGWNTLSIQMPVLAKDARYNDYVWVFPEAHPRIQAAIDYLRGLGDRRIVLIAHSCSVHMSMNWIARHGDAGFDAYVGIGMGATDLGQPMVEEFPLEKMTVPVLDIYGSEDYPAVQRMAPERLAAMRAAGNPKSRQVVVPGADHYFTGMAGPLLEQVADWLDQL